MSYQVKRTITTLVAGILILAAYCAYTFGKSLSGIVAPGDLKFWASSMLIFVAAGIVVIIVIQIIFHILFSIGIAIKQRDCDEKEIGRAIEASFVEDEMDKLIELKASRIGSILPGLGFVAALVALVGGSSLEVMLNIAFLSFFMGALVTSCVQLLYYRKSVPSE
ncbi:MAG: hypothetical protein E4H20_05930 [Spirochaetales bacterium]|nr:MAG: hypothetical protein E4H20_05930 [Spirochaetales bacterium]